MKISHKISILIGIGIIMVLIMFAINYYHDIKVAETSQSINDLNTANELILKAIIEEKKYLTEHEENESKEIISLFSKADQYIEKLKNRSVSNIQDDLIKLSSQIDEYQKTFKILTLNIKKLDDKTGHISELLYKFNKKTIAVLEKTKMDIGMAMMNVEEVDENIRNLSEIAMNTQLWMEQVNLIVNRNLFVKKNEKAFLKDMKKAFSSLKTEQKNAVTISRYMKDPEYLEYLNNISRVIDVMPEHTDKTRMLWKEKIIIEDKLDKIRNIIFLTKEKIILNGKSAIEKEQKNLLYLSMITFIIVIAAYILAGIFFLKSITKPFLHIVNTANAIAKGDFSGTININQKGEVGILAAAFQNMHSTILKLTMEIEKLIQSVYKGRLDIRCNEKNLEGDWRELVVGINNILDAFMSPFNLTSAYIDKIAKGDIPEKITDEYKGDFNKIINNLNMLIDAAYESSSLVEEIADGNLDIKIKERSENDRLMIALKTMTDVLSNILKETGGVIQNIRVGQLEIRGNADNFAGCWKELVTGFNKLINAFTGPISKTAEYIERISKGDIPEPITENYKGNFNDIKNNLNVLIFATQELTHTAQEIAGGNLNVKVEKRSDHDAMMQAFESMIEYIRDVADITEKVSNNQLQVKVSPKSEHDVLNHSLQRMVKNLRQMMEEIESSMNTVKQQNWFKTGLAELGNKMRGEQEAAALAKNIITWITNYLQAQIGAIYLADGNKSFYLAAAYAWNKRKGYSSQLSLGQGLAGQAALEKKSIVFSDIPEDYIQINSGLGKTTPKNILVFPFIYEQDTKGVIEIGTVHDFKETDMDFLTQASEDIAIAFNTAQTRGKMQELLKATSQQAEELKMQQDKLQSANNELESQTLVLKESESRLREQQEELSAINEEVSKRSNAIEQKNIALKQAQLKVEQKAQELEIEKNQIKPDKKQTIRHNKNIKKIDSKEIKDDRANIQENDRILLVVEDDPNFSRVLLNVAHEKDYKCLIAGSGEKGLELAENFNPDAIVMDLGLPEMNGWEVMEELKKNPQTLHIPVHIISSSDKPQNIESDIIGYMTKPVSMEEFDHVFKKIEKNISGSIKNILIVEDDKLQREPLIQLIAQVGINAKGAETAEQAFDILLKDSFDCMILDLGLGEMSGFDLLEKLKNTENIPQIPVIIYTGRELTQEEHRKLKKYSQSIIIKNEKSQERLLNEIDHFLNRIEQPKPPEETLLPVKTDKKQDVNMSWKKILIVDDDMRNVFVLTSLLEDKNFDILVGSNGKEALEQLDQNPDTDIVLMDIMMPEMDGYEATKAIRTQERFENLPIIALTAKAMKGDREKCMDAGANDYLTKPVDIDELFLLLEKYL
ncbi:response regulator [Desulfobacterales bacterium HSG17]|nr:response regulator [Desulfobacterales bacterium HSG17]